MSAGYYYFYKILFIIFILAHKKEKSTRSWDWEQVIKVKVIKILTCDLISLKLIHVECCATADC